MRAVRRRRRTILIAAAAVLAGGTVAALAVALAGGFDKTTTERATGGGTQVVRVALVDATLGLDVTPDVIAVDGGTRLILNVVNDGADVHDLAVGGGAPRTRMLEPGASQRLDLGTVTDSVEAWCTLPGHKLAGMALDVRLAGRVSDR